MKIDQAVSIILMPIFGPRDSWRDTHLINMVLKYKHACLQNTKSMKYTFIHILYTKEIAVECCMQRCIHLHIYNLISAMILINKCTGRGNPDVIFPQLLSNTTNMSSVKKREKGTTLLSINAGIQDAVLGEKHV